jgi:CRISPR-associated protein Cmr6
MRSALTSLLGTTPKSPTAHPGLLLERYAPLVFQEPPGTPEQKSRLGRLTPEDQDDLLERVARIGVSPAYRAAWGRWHAALLASDSGAITRVVKATGRLLLGHGNPSPTEVGITLHQVYGVPMIPGTALKGMLSHYLASWGRTDDEDWRGVGYDASGSPRDPPGAYHRTIFGAPHLPLGDGRAQVGAAGGVVFEDAWLIPGADPCPLALDVLTPHQLGYYREFGGKPGKEQPPNDWTDPVPVSFLTVKPGAEFLLAVSARSAGRVGAELAMAHLLDALEQWGIGAKTRAGYGRLQLVAAATAAQANARNLGAPRTEVPVAPASPALQALAQAVYGVLKPASPDQAPPVASRFDQLITDTLLDALADEERGRALAILKPVLDHAGLKKRRTERLAEIRRRMSP